MFNKKTERQLRYLEEKIKQIQGDYYDLHMDVHLLMSHLGLMFENTPQKRSVVKRKKVKITPAGIGASIAPFLNSSRMIYRG